MEGMNIRGLSIKTRGYYILKPLLRTCYEYDKPLELLYLSLSNVVPNAKVEL